MNKFSIKYKIISLILVSVLIMLPLNTINEHTYPRTGVYLCGPSPCLDNSPNHLSFFCDRYHKTIYFVK